MKTHILIFALIMVAFSSCKNLVPYTDNLQKQHQWTPEQLKGAQFYLSDKICLERELVKNEPDKIIGKIVVKNGLKKEIIYLKKGLPVVLVGTTETGAYIIKCESGDGKTLNFKVNPKNGKFVLLASNWKDGFGLVHYNGEEYYVSTDEGTTHLLIDLRKLANVDNKFHRATGVKVGKEKTENTEENNSIFLK